MKKIFPKSQKQKTESQLDFHRNVRYVTVYDDIYYNNNNNSNNKTSCLSLLLTYSSW